MEPSPSPSPTVRIERNVAGGDGMARLADGRVVFVHGAVAGDLVVLGELDLRRDFGKARVTAVVEPSPDRQEPPCEARRRGCGGCDWQHVVPARQLDLKVEIVREAFRRVGRIEHPWIEPGGSVPAQAYRTTVRLGADAAGGLGVREHRSHRVVTTGSCLVVHPVIDELLAGGLGLDGAGEVTLRVSASTGAITAAVPRGRRLRGPREMLDRIDTAHDAWLVERVGDVDLRVSMRSFFQSGPAAASLLGDHVRAAAGALLSERAGRVVDAYSGVGLFSATLGVEGGVAVESSSSSCADARHNLAGRSIEVVESTVEAWRPVEATLVIADPARRGMGRDGVRVLAATGAERIVVVSCDPVAAGRDGALLAEYGYQPAGVRVVDPFPQTHHVEVIARYDKRHIHESEFW